MNKLQQEIENLKKGCGEEFIWIAYFQDKRICGQIEDLKHGESILYCPECKLKLSQTKKCIEIFKEILDEWANKYCDEMQEEIQELKSQLEVEK